MRLLADSNDGRQAREQVNTRVAEPYSDADHRSVPHPVLPALRNQGVRQFHVGGNAEGLDDTSILAVWMGLEGYRRGTAHGDIGEIVFVKPCFDPEFLALLASR